MAKRISATALLLFSTFLVVAQPNEEAAIKDVVNKAYVEGIHNYGNLTDTRMGFHPGFDLLILENNQMTKLPIYNWVESIERRRSQNPTAAKARTSVNYVSIDITGTTAIAKIELFREEKKIFTDYLALYKFDEGWRIVCKTYFKH